MSWTYEKIINETASFVNLPQQEGSWTITEVNPNDETDTRDVTVSVGKTIYNSVGFLEGIDHNHDGNIDTTSVDYSSDTWGYGNIRYYSTSASYGYESLQLDKTSLFDNGLVVVANPA